MDEDFFQKKSGTTNLGGEFESRIVANLLLKLTIDENITDFKLSSNDAKFGKFDDIVLKVVSVPDENVVSKQEEEKVQKFAIQLKNINDNKKKLNLTDLADNAGNFSINEYFKDFENNFKDHDEDIKLVLFTNFHCDDLDGKEFKLANDTLGVRISKSQADVLLNTSNLNHCYEFHVVQSDNVDAEAYKSFFKRFVLYPNQASVKKIKHDIINTLQNTFHCGETKDDNAFDKILSFVTGWGDVEGRKEKLNKLLVERVLILRLLEPYIKPLSFCSGIVTEKSNLLKEAISKFHITFFEETNYDEVKGIWGDVKEELGDIAEVNKIRTKYQVKYSFISDLNELSDTEISKFLWLMEKCPLLIVDNKTTMKMINLFPDEKFILLGHNLSKTKFPNFAIFHSVSDVSLELHEAIVTKFEYSLQGKKKTSLKTLIEQNEKIEELITTNELVHMLYDSFRIGEEEEILPIPHIDDRLLHSHFVDYKFLKEINEDTLIVISCQTNFDKIKNFLDNFNLIEIENTDIHRGLSLNQFYQKDIYITRTECSLKEFDKICDKNSMKKRCHHFRVVDDGRLEWVRTRGSVGGLEPYRSIDCAVNMQELWKYANFNYVNIICDDPGMGKSTLMKSLKNNSSSTFWTILIYPKDHSSYFQEKIQSSQSFIEYILDEKCKKYKYTSFDKNVFERMKDQRQIIFMWDGLDEVSEDNLENIMNIIEGLVGDGFIQWITSRCNLQKTLENRFNVFCRTIEEFSEQQQTNYIEKRLINLGNDLQDVIMKIKENVGMVRKNNILGIPLQIFMFTELFIKNPEKYKTRIKNTFSITDLYRYFVDEKFNIYYREKAKFDITNDVAIKEIKKQKTEKIKNYEKVAVIAFFNGKVPIAEKYDVNEIFPSGKDDVGIITDITEEGKVTFLHNSYGEYFTASYLLKNHKRFPEFCDFIFQEKHDNIRYFFDLLSAGDSTAHVAVLYKNMEMLEKCKEDSLQRKDANERNILQIACSWGDRCPVLNTEESDGVYQVDDIEEQSKIQKSSEIQNILEYLSTRCDPEKKDSLFNINSFHYADKTFCLLSILTLSKEHQVDFNKLNNFKDACTVLCYCVKYGYSNLLDNFQLPFIITKTQQNSLLHLSAMYGTADCLQKLVNNKNYKKKINDGNVNGDTPLHVACQNGHSKIVELLIHDKVNINAVNLNGETPIYSASRNGHSKIVELLLQIEDIDIKASTTKDETPIFAACRNGHPEVVKLLLNLLDIHLPNKKGDTLLHVACSSGHSSTVKLLIDAITEARTNSFENFINVSNGKGWTPLMMACQNGHLDVVRLLFNNYSEIVDFNSSNGETPFNIACANGHLEIVRFLFNQGINIDDYDRSMHTASKTGHYNIVKFLIQSEMNVDGIQNGNAPIHAACLNGHYEIVKLLIDSHADCDIADLNGEAALHIVCRLGNLELVRLLLKSNANINARNLNANTPLHVACESGQFDVVQLLIDFNADLEVANGDDLTPSQLSNLKGHFDIVKLLDVSVEWQKVLPSRSSGITYFGIDFEVLFITNLTANLITNKYVKDMKLLANDARFMRFDDVILEVEMDRGNWGRYALQLKYSEGRRRMTKQNLEIKRGDFGIQKYYEDFKRNKFLIMPFRMIIFTNRYCDIPDGEMLILEGTTLALRIWRCHPDPLINTSKGQCFKFQVVDSEQIAPEEKKFFDRLFLYTNQANIEEIKEAVSKTLSEHFSHDGTVLEEYLKKNVSDWLKQTKCAKILGKINIKRALAIKLLSSFMKPLSFLDAEENPKEKLFKRAVSKFHVTFLEPDHYHKIKNIWRGLKDELLELGITEINKIIRKYDVFSKVIANINELSDEELSQILWLMGKCPLIVVENETTYRAINLYPDENNFILLGKNFSREKLPRKKSVFQNLSNLEVAPEVHKDIVKIFEYSFQNKWYAIQTLTEENKQMEEVITTASLVQMLFNSFNIGGKKEGLPVPHIERRLSSCLADSKFLEEIDEDTLIVISCQQRLTPQDFLGKKHIHISNLQYSLEEFDRICSNNPNKKAYHHFKITDDKKLEWVRSKGSISDIDDLYRSYSCVIKEQELKSYESYNRIHLICGEPGSGKSVLMKNLKNNSSATCWTILIDAKKHSSYFIRKNYNFKDFIAYILNEESEKFNSFDLNVLNVLKENHRLVFIWDELDEVSDENVEVICKLIDELANYEFVQWITSRCHMKKVLEERFQVFAKIIEPFNEEEKDTFVNGKLNSANGLSNTIKKVKNIFRMVPFNDILDTPQLIGVLIKLLYQDLKEKEDILTDLCRDIVNEKFNIYYRKTTWNFDRICDIESQIIEQHKNSVVENYAKAAMKKYFGEEISGCDEFLEKIRKSHDGVGIIQEVTQNRVPIFCNTFYGEYFAAWYLSKHPQIAGKLKKQIFDEKFRNIRFFFDLLLARNSPAHVAVLYKKNVEMLRTLGKKKLKSLDAGGRSPLHIACSWGRRCSLQMDKICDEEDTSVAGDFEIVKYLAKTCDPKRPDAIFKLNSFMYADQTLSLSLLPILSSKYELDFAAFEIYNYISTVLCYSVKYDFPNSFEVIEDIPFIETENGKNSLLHLAAMYGTTECLKKILSNDKYKKKINDGNNDGDTALHLACAKGNLEAVEYLVKHTADTNILNNKKKRPFHLAFVNKHTNVINFLIENSTI